MQVTSLEQLKNIKNTDLMELPVFDDGTPFVAELRKPNIVNMMISGKFPNTLMPLVMDMFQKGQETSKKAIDKAITDPHKLREMFLMLDVLAKDCLVNPSYSQLQEIGIQLNENQLSAILAYSQGGVKALENFRNQQKSNKSIESV